MKFEDRFLVYTTLGVTLAHVFAISWSVVFSKPLKISNSQEKFVVKTVSVKSVEEPPPKNAPKRQEVASIEKKKPQPNRAKAPSKPAPQKKISKKEAKKEPGAKRELTQREKILQKAKENIAKLQETRDNFRASRDSGSIELEEVGVIESLSIDNQEFVSSEDAGYYGALASRLKQALRLPEMGSVRIRLTLDRMGNVIAMETIAAESEYNRKFIEATVKKVQFPPFGKCFDGEGCHAFSITLANDL